MRKLPVLSTALLVIVLSSLFLSACTPAQPEIRLEVDQIDLGEVLQGEILKREVRLMNEGGAPLEIFSLSTSCGCTTASVDTTDISPGESALLTIEYDSGAHEVENDVSVHRQIFIATNDPVHPEVVINLIAEVVIELEN